MRGGIRCTCVVGRKKWDAIMSERNLGELIAKQEEKERGKRALDGAKERNLMS